MQSGTGPSIPSYFSELALFINSENKCGHYNHVSVYPITY